MITIAIANQKGGVAKTTTAVTAATWLSRQGHKVVLLDTDAQGNAAAALGLDKADQFFHLLIAKSSIFDCITYINSAHNLAIIRSGDETTTAKTVLSAQGAPVNILARALAPLHDRADFCIIDCSPSVDPLGLAVLYASDFVLIPTLCETLSLDGVRNIIGTIAKLRKKHKAATRLLGVLPTKYRSTTKEHHTNLKILANAYGSLIYPPIPLATVVAEAMAHHTSLWDYAPTHAATAAYASVLERMLRDVQKTQPH